MYNAEQVHFNEMKRKKGRLKIIGESLTLDCVKGVTNKTATDVFIDKCFLQFYCLFR